MSSISVVSRTAAATMKDRELCKIQFTIHSTIEEAFKALETSFGKYLPTFWYSRLGNVLEEIFRIFVSGFWCGRVRGEL